VAAARGGRLRGRVSVQGTCPLTRSGKEIRPSQEAGADGGGHLSVIGNPQDRGRALVRDAATPQVPGDRAVGRFPQGVHLSCRPAPGHRPRVDTT
jgi:hypothetical protein